MKGFYREYLRFYEKNKDDILKKEIGDYTSFKYASIAADFNHQFMRLSRGLTFNKKTGEAVLVGFEKFFNVGQLNEGERYSRDFVEEYSTLSFRDEYTFYEKMDGSLILMSIDNDKLIVGTTGGLGSEQALMAEALVDKPIEDFLKNNRDVVLLFELVGPDNKIVIDYKKSELVLLNATRKSNLSLVSAEELAAIQKELGCRAPRRFVLNKEELKTFLLENDEIEGFVTTNQYGKIVKLKTSQYLIQHRLRNTMESLRAELVIEALEENVLDDWLPELSEEKKLYIEEVISLYDKTEKDIAMHKRVFDNTDRKSFFTNKEIPSIVKHGVVAKDVKEYLLKYFKKNINSYKDFRKYDELHKTQKEYTDI